jgi:enoyl-CoA hydratase/carnithine racemase
VITLTVADGVATLLLNRPPVNAIGDEMIALFARKLDELEKRSDWTILHLRTDQKVFCAGADLGEVRERFDAADGPERTAGYIKRLHALFDRIESLPQVTLVEIGGAAMGGGLELALAFDLRIVAAEAKLGLPEARLGLIPGGGGTQRLTRLCGRPVAARLILSADVIDGAEAARLGIAQWAVPRTEIAARAGEIVKRIAGLPAAALHASKKCIAAAAREGNDGFRAELEETRRLSTNPESRERVAAFLAGQLR